MKQQFEDPSTATDADRLLRARADIEALQARNRELEAELAQLQARKRDFEAELAQLKRRQPLPPAQVAVRAEELDALRRCEASLPKLQRELSKSQAKAAEADNLRERAARVPRLEEALREALEQIVELRAELGRLKGWPTAEQLRRRQGRVDRAVALLVEEETDG